MGFDFIVMNRIPIERIKATRPGLFKPIAFHVLMHEYIHSPGYLDEQLVRQMVYDISRAVMGDSHWRRNWHRTRHDLFLGGHIQILTEDRRNLG